MSWMIPSFATFATWRVSLRFVLVLVASCTYCDWLFQFITTLITKRSSFQKLVFPLRKFRS